MAMSGPKKTVIQLVGVVALMGGLAWASVPFYDWFCRVTFPFAASFPVVMLLRKMPELISAMTKHAEAHTRVPSDRTPGRNTTKNIRTTSFAWAGLARAR